MNKFAKVAIPVVAIAAVGGLTWFSINKKNQKPVEVRIEAAEKRDLTASVTAAGQIQPRTKVNVSADVTGKIIRLAVKEGDMVTKGQFLLQIDPDQPTAALQRSEAQLATSKAQMAQIKTGLTQARNNYERNVSLRKTSALGVTDEQLEQLKSTVDNNEAQMEAANFSVQQAEAGVRDAKQALSRTTITAPMSGKVTRLVVQEGEVAIQGTLNKDAATLLTISDMSSLETRVKVDETDVARIAVGDSAIIQIDAFPDTTFVGRVVEISNSSTKATSTTTTTDQAVDYEVRVQLLNPPKETRPDFSAIAKIVTDTRSMAISIPIIALTVRENQAIPNGDSAVAGGKSSNKKEVGKKDVEGVFVVGADNKVTFAPVKIGIAGEHHFEVVSGLKVGDRIVAGTYQAIRDLKDGTVVHETKVDDKKAAAGKKS